MSYVDNTLQCDQCEKKLAALTPGMLILMEVPGNPKRTHVSDYPVYHFCNLEEQKAWLEGAEQVIIGT